MKALDRATQIIDEWFPELRDAAESDLSDPPRCKLVRLAYIHQLAAEFQQVYANGYNACIEENLALKQNQTKQAVA